MKKTIKLIEKIAFSVLAVAVAATVLAVILVSYFDYRDYYEEATREPDPPIKTAIQGLDVALAEDVEYFANDLAIVSKSDLIVTATFRTGSDKVGYEEYTEEVAADDYDLSVPADFTVKGGDITVTYLNKTAKLTVSLTPVVLEGLRIAETPYTVYYKTGATFDPAGMVVYAVYNDSSEKLIPAEKYTVDTETPLAKGATKHKLSYTDDGVTVAADIAINVADNFENGDVVALTAGEAYFLTPGMDIADAKPTVLGRYESGNRIPLKAGEYTVTNTRETVRLGRSYTIDVKYNANEKLTASIPAGVRMHVEGEETNIVGGAANAEESYVFEKGVFTPTGQKPGFAGGFSKAVNGGSEGSLSFTVTSYTDCVSAITMLCGNSYCVQEGDAYWMKALQINTILDVTVNGEPITVNDNVILKGCGPNSTYAPLFNVYYDFTFEGVPLVAGTNEIKFTFKPSTKGEKNTWGELLSTLNIDWINVDTYGTEVPDASAITSIKIVENFEVKYGTNFDALDVIVVANLTGGARVLLDSRDVNITKPSGKAFLGTYTITAALAGKPTVTDTLTFNIKNIRLEAEDAEFTKTGVAGQNSRPDRVFVETAREFTPTEDGLLLEGDPVTYISGLDWATTNQSKYSYKTFVKFSLEASAGEFNLDLRVDNAMYFENGTGAGGKYYTQDYKLKDVLTLEINGVSVPISDDAIVEGYARGCSNSNDIWLIFQTVHLGNIELKDGINTITFYGKTDSTVKNRWSEIAVPRFDYIELSPALGDSDIVSIAPMAEAKLEVGKAWTELKMPSFKATYTDGTTKTLSASQISYTLPAGNIERDTTVKVSVTANPQVSYDLKVTALTIESIAPVIDNLTATVGSAWTTVKPAFTATLSDGTTRALADSEVSYTLPSGTVTESVTITVSLVSNPSVTCELHIIASGLNIKIGYKQMMHEAGKGKENANGYWGNLDGDDVFTFTFTSSENGKTHLWMDISNGNYRSSADGIAEWQVNQSFVVYVNGTAITIDDSVKMAGNAQGDWEIFAWVDFGEIDVVSGTNTVKITYEAAVANNFTHGYGGKVTGNIRSAAITAGNPASI